MRNNAWFKLAAVSLTGLIMSFVILWGVGQFSQYKYNNAYMNNIQNSMNGQGYRNMQGMNGQGYMNMSGMNAQGSMNMPGMNAQGSMNMPSMNMQGGMSMPNMNSQGNSNMQSGMGMMGGM